MSFTIENSLKALRQFKTDEERAELFLEITENLFGAYKQLSEAESENAEIKKLVRELVETLEKYGDEKNYSPKYMRQGVLGSHGKQLLFIDGGQCARSCLSRNKDLIIKLKGE